MVGLVAVVVILGLRWSLMWLKGTTFEWTEGLLPLGMLLGWSLVTVGEWRQVKKLVGEVRLPVRNVVVGLVVAVVGVWMAYSGSSLVGIGMTLGLGWRLWSEFVESRNWMEWYLVIKRRFTEQEHKWVKLVWLVLMVVQSLRVI